MSLPPVTRAVRSVLAGVLLLPFLLLPGLASTALAQRPVAAIPYVGDGLAQFVNASGRHIVAYTPARLTPEDTDDAADVYVFTVNGGTWRRLPRPALVGIPNAELTHHIVPLSLSDDGRYLAFETFRGSAPLPFAQPLQTSPPVLARYDLATGVRNVIRDAQYDTYKSPVMSRDGSTFAWVGDNNAVIVGKVGQTPLTVGEACPAAAADCISRPALTAAGERVLYLRGPGAYLLTDGLEVIDLKTYRRDVYPEVRVPMTAPLATTATGTHVLWALLDGTRGLFDLATRRVDTIPASMFAGGPPLAMSDDADYVLGGQGTVYDRRATWFVASGGDTSRGLTADGRYIAVTLPGSVFALLDLDSDEDGMRDPWETTFQLDPTDPADALLDADGDGRTNRDEYAARSHPRGVYRRYFAEGVSSSLFETAVSVPWIGGPGAVQSAIMVTFIGDDGVAATRTRGVGTSLLPDPEVATPPATLGTGQFSIEVEGAFPFAAERETTWRQGGMLVGAHATAGTTPSTTWYFAEGATTNGFQLFYLLANPGDADSLVTITYLCAGQGGVARQHLVPSRRRVTVWGNQEGGPLGAAECGARIEATQPVVAERSLYLLGPGGFTAGTASVGAHAPATTWWFAEGDTRQPFDTFLLLANPGDAAADVSVHYLVPGAAAVHRSYSVPAQQRLTVWVDQEAAALVETAVSLRVESSAPIVAERAMWWAAPGASGWTEAHAELGATAPATSWAFANVPAGANVTMLNDSAAAGLVHLTAQLNGPGGGAQAFVHLPPGRTTLVPAQLWPGLPPATYNLRVRSESADGIAPPVPFIVERTSYAPGMTAGTSYLGTPVP